MSDLTAEEQQQGINFERLDRRCAVSAPTQERRRWTAEDYDVIEELVELRLPSSEIGKYLDPPADGGRVRKAARAAGIPIVRRRGRPTLAEQAEWLRIRIKILGDDQADVEARERITAFADGLGYTVEIKRKATRDLSALGLFQREVSEDCAPGGQPSVHQGDVR